MVLRKENAMHYRRLGKSGLKVSEIALGAWLTFGNQIDEDTAIKLLHAAYEQGVNFFDNADAYAGGKAETVMGKAIQGIPREELVISSKVFFPTMQGPNGRGLSRKHIRESIHASLRRLGTEYIDIYYCHRFDPDTPIEEVVRTMDDLIHEGKIFYWGTSEWEAQQVVQAYGIAKQLGLNTPSVEQPQYNLFHRKRVEDELAPLCKEFGLGLTTFSPLYSGILSGKYNDGIPEGSRATMSDVPWIRSQITPKRIAVVRQLTQIAQNFGFTTAQLAIAWILRRKDISAVITGASRPEQLDENLVAPEVLPFLTDSVLEQIDRITTDVSE
jgi:voltage-dependent potassium channel beta subunit